MDSQPPFQRDCSICQQANPAHLHQGVIYPKKGLDLSLFAGWVAFGVRSSKCSGEGGASACGRLSARVSIEPELAMTTTPDHFTFDGSVTFDRTDRFTFKANSALRAVQHRNHDDRWRYARAAFESRDSPTRPAQEIEPGDVCKTHRVRMKSRVAHGLAKRKFEWLQAPVKA